MKHNDIIALHEKTLPELHKQLAELRQELAKTTMKLKSGKLEDIKQPSKMRDDIARVMTVIREKELLAAAEELTQPAAVKEEKKK